MCLLEGACGLKTLTSKYAYVRSRWPPHNPFAAISKHASSWVLAEVADKRSPEIGIGIAYF